MRTTALLLFVSVAGAQESPEDDHDKYGFPMRFDAEVITLNDLLRSLDRESVRQIGNVVVERNAILVQKLDEKVGALYGLEVEDREIGDHIERQIAKHDSEAEFYEYLAQQGLTLERFREDVRRKILDYRLQQLIRGGYVAQGKRLLPWDPNPSPREVKVAFENDPARQTAGKRVRWADVTVSLTEEERKKIAMKRFRDPDMTDEQVSEERAALLEPRLEKARELLAAGKGVAEIGEALGLPVLEREAEVDGEGGGSALRAFLRTAEEGQRSGLLKIREGAYIVVEVRGISRADQLTLNDPQVVNAYFARIAQAKQMKARSILRLRALDKSSVRPRRVREDLRELILTDLRAAQRKLRTLGLH